jgi:hypothetical protein
MPGYRGSLVVVSVFSVLAGMHVACSGAHAGSDEPAPAPSGIERPPQPNMHAPIAPPRSEHDASLPVADAGAPEAAPPFVIAPRPPAPQLVSLGGPVLDKPVVIVVTWDADPDRVATEKFATDIGKTAYWKTLAAEYGVGELRSGPPVHITAPPPAAITDDAIATFVAAQIDAAEGAWPSSTSEQYLYTLFYPASTRITAASDGSVACTSFYGWHAEATLASGRVVPFAVLPKCVTDTVIPFHGLDVITATAAHEWFEAVTDPFPLSQPAYAAMDPAHDAYGDNYGAEIGDLCQSGPESTIRVPGVDLAVQRAWSNVAASAGHDPCQPPAVDTAYFAAVPRVSAPSATSPHVVDGGARDAAPADAGPDATDSTAAQSGLHLADGEAKTVDVVLYSDRPSAPWTVSAVEGAELTMGTAPLVSFAFDRTSGKNGDVLHMTLTRHGGDAGSRMLYVVTSTLDARKNEWVGYVDFD